MQQQNIRALTEAQQKQRSCVESTQQQISEEKKVLQKQSSIVNQDKIAVQKELQELQPIIDEITEAIQSISKNELMELAKIVHPTRDM